jgi:hypothetical protein
LQHLQNSYRESGVAIEPHSIAHQLKSAKPSLGEIHSASVVQFLAGGSISVDSVTAVGKTVGVCACCWL